VITETKETERAEGVNEQVTDTISVHAVGPIQLGVDYGKSGEHAGK
jgi:hypothetical protein